MTKDPEKTAENWQGDEVPLSAPRSLLRKYDKLKLELAGHVRDLLGQDGIDEYVKQKGLELLRHLAEDRFNVAVVGRFSRGKSALVNAVLGTDRLPTGILPLTSVLTMVRYGSSERALVYYEQSLLTREISLDQLHEYVTQEENPGNSKRVAYVEVQIPSETLRRGFSFVDTPGLGSPIAESTAITTDFLPEMDAVVLVTSFEAALSFEEVEFLWQAGKGARKIFLVINKLDLVSGAERDEVVRYVEDRLMSEAGRTDIKVFAISARDGLNAKLFNDARILQTSGLPEFEQELMSFLATEKNAHVLALTGDRLLELAAKTGLSPHAALPTRVREIQNEFLSYVGIRPAAGLPLSAAVLLRTDQVQLEKSCPICDEVVSRMFDFFAQRQYLLNANREAQSAHATTGGFCPEHTWQYEKLASPRGICAAYAVVFDAVVYKLRRMKGSAQSVEELSLALADLAEMHPTCKACEAQVSVEEAAFAKLISQVSEGSKTGKQELPLLCFQHLPSFLTRIEDLELARKLVEQQTEICERISENMQHYVLKFDSVRRTLLSEEELRAHQQGLNILAGHRKIVTMVS